VAYRGTHEKVKEYKAAQSKHGFDDAADQGIELQEAAQRPARGPGSADHFGSDKDRDRGEGGNMKPVDFLLFSQVQGAPLKIKLPLNEIGERVASAL
jgi:hypothetical protein